MRRLATALLVVVLLLVGAGGIVYVVARRSLAVVNGTIAVSGISAPVDIVRDADDIPHIFAATRLDALYGLGYVHAQDRLWQMEMQRRIGHGRLSEIFGAATLPQDRFLRTVGFGRAARQAWDAMPERARTQVNAYVAGVNAFIGAHHGTALPPEFSLLRFEPEPWTGPDVVVWVKMMAWDLSANYSFELLRHDLAASVGSARMAQLMPPYARDGLSILSKVATTLDTEDMEESTRTSRSSGSSMPSVVTGSWAHAFASSLSHGEPAVRDFLLGNATTEALGSNNWVVDGSMTASGKPMLANDPHLGTHLPSTWYLAHMSAGDFDVIGATLPGAPAVALGRNRFVAWGATNVAADVEDLYREHIDPTGRSAEFRGAQEPLQIIGETISVKGATPVHVDVRVTRHGPLVSDAINAINAAQPPALRAPPVEPLAFRWTALDPDDSTLESFFEINQASNWSDFTDALRHFVVPSQNFVYADVQGHIGYYAPGRIPIRAHGDGSQPADGWTGDAEWTGWVRFDDLPHALDPPGHFIVTANNRPAPATYPYLLGLEWAEPYRAQRITDLLRRGNADRAASAGSRGPADHPSGAAKFTADDFAAMQRDTLSLHAQALLPLLIAHAHPDNGRDRQALDILRSWNFDARADLAAPAVFEAWFLQLAPALAGDDLGPLLTAKYQGKFSFVARFVANTLTSNDATWCDDARTPRRETCDDTVTSALHTALDRLSGVLGGDLTRWQWGSVHRAVFPHQLDSIAVLRPLLSRSVPNGGDWSTVDVGTVDTDRPYEQHAVPGYREIIDLSPANDSRFLVDVGESGHFLSPHYDDFLLDWRAVKHRRMRMNRSEIENGAIGRLRLLPHN